MPSTCGVDSPSYHPSPPVVVTLVTGTNFQRIHTMNTPTSTPIRAELVGGRYDGDIIELSHEHAALDYHGVRYYYEQTRDGKLIYTHWRPQA